MKRLLVVDDEREVADALAELLAETYEVTTAYDGAQALAVLERGEIDGVVLDLMMPVMSGEALMAELERRNLVVPVIFASAAPDLRDRAQRSRANDFIAKPFDPEALEKKLAQLFGLPGPGGSSAPSGGTAEAVTSSAGGRAGTSGSGARAHPRLRVFAPQLRA